MLPNSRKIPTVPSATSYQTEPTPLVQQDAMQRSPASSSSGLAPPTASNASKSSNFFSRFTRRRSQSTAAVTPKHFPAPSASISTMNSKASQSSTSTIPHQPIPVTPTSVPKVQRKPIAAEPASSKKLQSSTTNSKSSYRPSTRDSASRSSTSKPVVKKKGSSVSLDPLRKLTQKLEKAGVSSPLLSPKSTSTTFPASATEKNSFYTPRSPVITPPPSSSSSSTSDAFRDLKKSSSASRPLFHIAEASAETSGKPMNSNGNEKVRRSVSAHTLQSNGSSQPTQVDQPDLRALGVREKDLKAVQESLDRLSGGSTTKTANTTSLFTTIESSKTMNEIDRNQADKSSTEHAEPPSLAEIVLQNTKSRKNARVIPDIDSLGMSQTVPLRREDVKSDNTHYTLSSDSFYTLNGDAKIEDNESDSNSQVNGDSMLESDSDDDDSDEADNGEETFVDATGMSQEDIERERAERRLTKRLSGGHYGSAGGLLLSIAGQSTDNKHRTSTTSFGSFEKALQEFERRGSLGILSDSPLSETSGKHEYTKRNKAVPPVPPVKDRTSPDLNREPEILIDDVSTPISETSDTVSLDPSIDEALKTEAEEAARKLWTEDADFIEKEAMTEWMGQPRPLNSLALTYYMKMFDFSRLRLDTAFRRLCSKLYMKAESQQIDRILEVFARRYWHCNKQSVFGSADVVYAVTYSMLLLNTDLHVVQGGHTRMTRSAFVRNTMSAAYAQGPGNDRNKGQQQATKFPKWWESEMEIYLRELYYCIKQRQILQPREHQQESYRPKSFLDASGVNGLKRSMGSIVRKSARESVIINSDASQPLARPSIGNLQRPTSPPNMRRRQSVTSLASAGSHGSNPRTPVSPYQTSMSSPGHNQLFTSQPPFYKEGIVMRKHLLESGDQKAKNRDWKECFVIVNRGDLHMYSLSPNGGEANHRRSMLRASSASLVNLADSLKSGSNTFSNTMQPQHLSPNAQPVESVSLNHSLSNALPPPGYNRQRPFVFALQLPNGGVYLFQVAVQEHVNDWVSTCNYWAARGSKEPLTGGVSNMEYGWGDCLDDVILDLDAVENGDINVGNSYLNPDQVMLYEWRPPAPPLVSSTLSEIEQMHSLQRQLSRLTADINAHREIKKKIEVKFPVRSTNNVKALTNWENRSRYLLHEIIKLQNYCDILEKALAISDKEMKESS